MTTTLTAQRAAAEVRAEAARQRVSAKSLAEALGMSYSALTRRLTGDVEFSLSELTKIAETLRVPLSTFIHDDPEPVSA